MFELMYQQMQIAFAERINKFIYTVRRIPVIGKCIPEELYARVSLKRVLAVLALNWINDEIKALGKENFFHKDYEATLLETYGKDYEDQLVIEGGELASSTNDTAK